MWGVVFTAYFFFSFHHGLLFGKIEMLSLFPAERNRVGIGAVEKNIMLILDIISITDHRSQVGELR